MPGATRKHVEFVALASVGCAVLVDDAAVAADDALDERPELAKVLDQLRPGDTLVVWKTSTGWDARCGT
jgi:DNA invertase Pin-like site-specific DNA recombinase